MNSRFRRVDHTAIVVPDLDSAIEAWVALTGGHVETRQVVEHQQVEIAMLLIGDTRIELIRPLNSESGVAKFLERRGTSLHHVAFQVDDIAQSLSELEKAGYEPIDSTPRHGAHGLVAFLHPRSTERVLVELIEPTANE